MPLYKKLGLGIILFCSAAVSVLVLLRSSGSAQPGAVSKVVPPQVLQQVVLQETHRAPPAAVTHSAPSDSTARQEAPQQEAPQQAATPKEEPGEEATQQAVSPEEEAQLEAPGEETPQQAVTPREEAPGEEAPGAEAAQQATSPGDEAPGEEAPQQATSPGEEAPQQAEPVGEGTALTTETTANNKDEDNGDNGKDSNIKMQENMELTKAKAMEATSTTTTSTTTTTKRTMTTGTTTTRTTTTRTKTTRSTTTISSSTTSTFTTTTTTTTTAYFKSQIKNPAPLYAVNDALWFKDWAARTKYPGMRVPRVLIFTWATPDSWSKYTNEVYWKECYARAHGFDIEFTSSQRFSALPYESLQGHLGRAEAEVAHWAWASFVQERLASGEYDYVFLMAEDTLILERHFDFPIWAWDRGHDITLMDQYHFIWPEAFGYNLNNILFRASDFAQEFMREYFEYRKNFNIQQAQGPFMETILTTLSREAAAEGRISYDGHCGNILRIDAPYPDLMAQAPSEYIIRTETYSQCFFDVIEALAGAYGFRNSKHIGFHPTFLQESNGNRMMPQFYTKPSILGPWANCWRNVRAYWPDCHVNCFAYRWTGRYMQMFPGDDQVQWGQVHGQCPDTTYQWHTSMFNSENRTFEIILDLVRAGGATRPLLARNQAPIYSAVDVARYLEWPQRGNMAHNKLPRVLIYTWCTPQMYRQYVNELYWKACYAHMHGFELLFTSSPGYMGSIPWDWSRVDDVSKLDHFFTGETTYAWVRDIQKYLFSGDYDYVFLMGVDVVLQENWLEFPVWAYDVGHDITLMDQHHLPWPDAYGLHANNILFKASDTSRRFLELLAQYEAGHYLQGDSGPFMETILSLIGEEVEACQEGMSGNGADYRGCRNQPTSGRTCQKWSVHTPHAHVHSPADHPGKGLGDHNYCRNPEEGLSTIWCYTTDPDSRFEYCDPQEDRGGGYKQSCLDLLRLQEPAINIMRANLTHWGLLNDRYSNCFFTELDRLTGYFASRKSQAIGFYPTYLKQDGVDKLPADFQSSDKPFALGPWANCWDNLRKIWTLPDNNCFAFRGGEPRDGEASQVTGKCPETTFQWENSPYNPVNLFAEPKQTPKTGEVPVP